MFVAHSTDHNLQRGTLGCYSRHVTGDFKQMLANLLPEEILHKLFG
jgi:hypothetical protein